MPDRDSRLTVQDAARELGVSEDTVRRLIEQGELEAIPGGVGSKRRHWRISRASVRRYQAARRPAEGCAPR